MPHSRTAKKNHRKNVKRRAQNRAFMSALRTQLKRVRAAVTAKDSAGALEAYPHAQQLLDKGARSFRIHRNKAARLKSRLSKAIASI